MNKRRVIRVLVDLFAISSASFVGSVAFGTDGAWAMALATGAYGLWCFVDGQKVTE